MAIEIRGKSLVGSTLGLNTKEFIQESAREGTFTGELKTHLGGRVLLLGTGVASAMEASIRAIMALFTQALALLTLYQAKGINRTAKAQLEKCFDAILLTTASLVSLVSPRLFPTVFTSHRKFHVETFEKVPDPVQSVAQAITDIALLPLRVTALCFAFMVEITMQSILLPFRIMLLPFQIAFLPLSLL